MNCEFCGQTIDGANEGKAGRKTLRHPKCKDAANFLDAFQRAVIQVEGMTPDKARILRSRLMSLGNLAQWRTPEMGKNLREKRNNTRRT